jgi:hypothetical protein
MGSLKTKIIITLITYTVIGLVSGYSGYKMRKPQTVYVDVPRTVNDTLYVTQEVIKYKWLPAKRDTIWNTITKTIVDTLNIMPHQVAYIDTALKVGGTKYGDLAVAYYPIPWDRFNVQFRPAPLPSVTVTKFVTVEQPWYKHPAVALGVGLMAGAFAVEQIRK